MAKIVAHIIYSFNIGGAEKVIANFINSCDEAEYEHVVITMIPEHEMREQINRNLRCFSVDKKEGADILVHYRLFKLLRKLKPDVVHSYNFGCFEFLFTAWLSGVKTRVHSEHGRPGEYDEKVRKRRTFIRKLFAPLTQYFVVVSPDLNEWALTDLGLGKDKVKLVYNGVDVHLDRKARAKVENQPFILLTVGRLVEVKNHALLLKAFSVFTGKYGINASLKLVGEGPLLSSLESLAEELGISKHVEFVGPVSDVSPYLNNADLFVLSSNYEAMPMSVLEAMSYCLPVVCTEVGGVNNIVENRKTGVLVPSCDENAMAEAFYEIYSNQELRRKISEEGNEMVVKKFSTEYMRDQYLALY